MSIRSSINVSTKQVVYSIENYQQCVGFERAVDLPTGWLFDIKRWGSIFDLRLPTLPRLAINSLQGVNPSEFFQCGVGSVYYKDCIVDTIRPVLYEYDSVWCPIIKPGKYFRYQTELHLYSDRSRVQHVDPRDNQNNRNCAVLDAVPDYLHPVSLVNYSRHPVSGDPTICTRVSHVSKFTGKFENGIELETRSISGGVNWNNVDINKKEFIIDTSKESESFIRLNKNYIFRVGVTPSSIADFGACYSFGPSNGQDYQVFYTKYFPVVSDDFMLYATDGTTSVLLERVDSWFDLINTEAQNKYFLDSDLGIIYLGDAAHGGIPALGHYLVGAYSVTLRLEYEEVLKNRDICAHNANINPISQSINQGFICITNKQFNAYNIQLKLNKSLIPFTVPREYGPIYVGSDYGVLKATVTDIDGTPIPDIEVGFTMSPIVGFLSSGSVSASITNGKGVAYSAYQPPTSADSLGIYSNVVNPSDTPGSDDLLIKAEDINVTSDASNIYLYKILKDDILMGYENVQDWIYYHVDMPSWVVDAETYTQWQSEVIAEYDLKDWNGIQPDGSIPGRKVLVYQINGLDNIDASAINPITGEYGAVMPVRPTGISKITDTEDENYGYWKLTYGSGVLETISQDKNPLSIGGYWVAMPRLVTFQAHCYSRYYNRIIYSNKVTARISLPQYLLGVYTDSLLRNIPFGWKLRSDIDNISAGLDGATFISINPRSGPYEILDLIHSTATDTWASSPQDSLGLKFNVTE